MHTSFDMSILNENSSALPDTDMALSGLEGVGDPQTDAIWILSSTFIVFTMQSGFGLLESGSVSVKNELNIMVKNAVDVIFGGLTYWAFGYAFSFGEDPLISNPVIGWGDFFVTASEEKLGWIYSKFFFQASFATTATTIVSGAMAERTKLGSYMVFSMLNTILFSLPAHWVWATNGWLYTMGAVDIAGAGPVHLVGGLTGLVATLILKPRHNRYRRKKEPEMSSPTNAVLGMFMLWWGWLGFNCGSTFGISGVKWKLAARSAASTLCASVSGGTAGLLLSYLVRDRKFDVRFMINGLLGSLVSVTASCALVQPWEGLIIGMIGSLIANGSVALLNKLKIDDPVGCVGTHAMSGMWGLLAAGLFTRKDTLLNALYLNNVQTGLFYGGGFRQLGVQCLAIVSIGSYSIITSFVLLKLIECTMGLRVPLVEEIVGADIVEHGIGDVIYDRKTKRLVIPDDSEMDDHYDELGLGAELEHTLKRLRQRSMSGASHLLGYHVTKDASEINSEIRDSMRNRARKRSKILNTLRNGQVQGMDEHENKNSFSMSRSSSKSRQNGRIPNTGTLVPDDESNVVCDMVRDVFAQSSTSMDFSDVGEPNSSIVYCDGIRNDDIMFSYFDRADVSPTSTHSSLYNNQRKKTGSDFIPAISSQDSSMHSLKYQQKNQVTHI